MPTDKKTETLASAYAKAFAEIDKALKSSSNPHFKSKYADITAVIDSIKPALVKHGLFFTQLPSHHEAGVAVKTVLYSEAANGEAEGMDLGTVVVPVDRNNAQGYGSALTYARRYGLVTAFGVPTEDDDGNAAAAAPPQAEPMISEADWMEVIQLVEKTGTETAKICKAYNVESLKELTDRQAQNAKARLQKTLADMAKEKEPA
jgi:hypothetical protein